MKAIKFQVTIGPDHRVVLDVPQAEGPAEVIVLVADDAPTSTDFAEYLRNLESRSRKTRSKEEIDRELWAEREGWER